MSDLRDALVDIIQRKESDKSRGSWTLADLALHLTLFYSFAQDDSGSCKETFYSCSADEKDNTVVLLKRRKGAPAERVGCMDVIKILDEMDAWSNPGFVQAVSDYLADLLRQDI